MTRTNLVSCLLAASLGLPALGAFIDESNHFLSDWDRFLEPLENADPVILDFNGNWWQAAVTVNALGAFDRPDVWTGSFTCTHIAGPHGESENEFHSGQFTFNRFLDDGRENLGLVVNLSNSDPHSPHEDLWHFTLDRSLGSGMLATLEVFHTPAPSSTLVLLGMMTGAMWRRR
jgi:hypothetical protein